MTPRAAAAKRASLPPTMLELRGIDVAYGSVMALRGVDLQVPARSLTTVIGPNGAGKTTLLRTIAGVLKPRAGEVVLDGELLGRRSPEMMLERGVAMVPEGRHVFPHLSVADNLLLGAFRFRRDAGRIRSRIDSVYEWFPVLRERRGQLAGTLSGGEQQMLAIGRALMSDPVLLLLDEPSLGLAPRVVRSMLELLRGLTADGVTVLLVEQFAYLALQAADHGCLLEGGVVVKAARAKDLLADPRVRRAYVGGGTG
jgi:branched-chain amino acid transport system ATP-binding protein